MSMGETPKLSMKGCRIVAVIFCA